MAAANVRMTIHTPSFAMATAGRMAKPAPMAAKMANAFRRLFAPIMIKNAQMTAAAC